jgi:anti-sigma28 factor (negative regulator of flagellin synthesis)
MYHRSEDERAARGGRAGATRFSPARQESRSERVHEIRRRIADDAYRSDAVAEEIARHILMSRDL